MSDRRRKDVNWQQPETGATWESATVAVLMDLRDEMKRLNNLLGCQNFIAVPQILREIKRNTNRLPVPAAHRSARKPRRQPEAAAKRAPKKSKRPALQETR